MEKPDKMKMFNDINACINRTWLLFSVVAKMEHVEATTAYLEEKDRASNLLAGLSGEESLGQPERWNNTGRIDGNLCDL